VFRAVKRLVSTLETKSFKPQNTLFQAYETAVSRLETKSIPCWNFYLHTSLCLYAGMFISNGDRWRL